MLIKYFKLDSLGMGLLIIEKNQLLNNKQCNKWIDKNLTFLYQKL
jgi:hypothetical protein